MAASRQRTIWIVGAGGCGFWTAVGLSRSGILGIKVIDDDTLEGGLGANRLPMAIPTTKKVDLLTGFLRVQMGGEVPGVVDGRFRGTEVRRNDIVVDCSDMDGNTRRTIWGRAQARGARCIRVSYDGANSTVVVAEGLPMTVDETASGYANVPSMALSLFAGGVAAEVLTEVIRALNAGHSVGHIEFQISLKVFISVREVTAA
jgi:hypothetical protein